VANFSCPLKLLKACKLKKYHCKKARFVLTNPVAIRKHAFLFGFIQCAQKCPKKDYMYNVNTMHTQKRNVRVVT